MTLSELPWWRDHNPALGDVTADIDLDRKVPANPRTFASMRCASTSSSSVADL
jgi:hypothetical protein